MTPDGGGDEQSASPVLVCVSLFRAKYASSRRGRSI